MTPPSALQRYISWIVDKALPRWAVDGYDPSAGRFRERLDMTITPMNVPQRAMVQARQIFVYADAARRGWFDEGGQLAERAMASMLRNFCTENSESASFAFSIDSAGKVVSDIRDAYTHAFILFSIAALYRLNGDQRLLQVADKTIRFLDDDFADHQHGGLFDTLPTVGGEKRQNPHMHLLEAYLFLDQAAPECGYLERAATIVKLFKERLFDEDHGCLLEYFNTDWTYHDDPARGTIWEPGHHFEWVWLLGEFGVRSGESIEPWASVLYENAVEYGVGPHGMIADEVRSTDKKVIRTSSRVWPHTEAIKATRARGSAGNEQAAVFGETVAGALLTHFLDKPFTGGWIDHITQSGIPLVDYVPASSLYHLHLAAAEASEAFRL